MRKILASKRLSKPNQKGNILYINEDNGNPWKCYKQALHCTFERV